MSDNQNVLLDCCGLGKNYGSKVALRGIDLQILSGRIVGLLGPNGSGKTTFLKICEGLLTPSSGTVKICGMDPGPVTKGMVSYLPDAEYLPEWMKVDGIVGMFRDFYTDFDLEKANELLMDLKIDGTQKYKTLSKGTKEKVQLVLTMSRQSRLYLLDEPIGGVDPAARDYILNTILTNYSEDSTVIISTHLISDIEQVLDDVIFLDQGEIRLHKDVDAIRGQYGKSVDALFREVYKC